ncbi:MAG: hypothetical protein CVU63_20720, partial [Deltaproteobacteria bacterium HGW-Deltaproteobacteria-20]
DPEPKGTTMNKTTILLLSSALTFAYALTASHVTEWSSSDTVACGDDAKKKKKGNSDEDEKS